MSASALSDCHSICFPALGWCCFGWFEKRLYSRVERPVAEQVLEGFHSRERTHRLVADGFGVLRVTATQASRLVGLVSPTPGAVWGIEENVERLGRKPEKWGSDVAGTRGPHSIETWLILPVVICLSQRLSHACLSISFYTAKLRMAH